MIVNYAPDTLTYPELHPNQILSKNLKGHRSYEANKNVSTEGHQAESDILDVSVGG